MFHHTTLREPSLESTGDLNLGLLYTPQNRHVTCLKNTCHISKSYAELYGPSWALRPSGQLLDFGFWKGLIVEADLGTQQHSMNDTGT